MRLTLCFKQETMARRYGIDEELAGKWAECDGGGATTSDTGQLLGYRESFRGLLTGLYFEEGDPLWRWYQIVGLVMKPDDYQDEMVWCEKGFIFLVADRYGKPL